MPNRRNPYPEWIHERRLQLGHRIAVLRRERAWSQDDLAERVGIDRRSVQRYERGIRDPRFADLLLIADALGVPLADLIQ